MVLGGMFEFLGSYFDGDVDIVGEHGLRRPSAMPRSNMACRQSSFISYSAIPTATARGSGGKIRAPSMRHSTTTSTKSARSFGSIPVTGSSKSAPAGATCRCSLPRSTAPM
jgi:hypothetical protein